MTRYGPLLLLLASPVAAQQPRVFKPVVDLRIDASVDLSRVGYILVARDGAILVSQPEDEVIRYFGPKARTGTIGRRGEGPGEFENLTRVGWRGDSVWALDPNTSRVTIFGPDYKLARTMPFPQSITLAGKPASGAASLYVQAMLPDGTLRAVLARPDKGPMPPWMTKADSAHTTLVRVSPSGALLNRITVLPRSECVVQYAFDNGKGIGYIKVPLCTEPLSTDWDGGYDVARVTMNPASAKARSYSVSVVEPSGTVRFAKAFAYAPIPIAKRAFDSVLTELDQARRKSGGPVMPTPKMTAPTHYPPVRRVVLGRDDTVWLEEWTRSADHSWRILDRMGNPIGSLTLPANVLVRTADRRNIWAVERDADDLETIVRYRL